MTKGKLRTIQNGIVAFFCPGCLEHHQVWIATHETRPESPVWGFNGDFNKPTFTPSILVQGHKLVKDKDGKWTGEWERDASGNTIPSVCHSYVTDGVIGFLSDCTHEMAGKAVMLPEIETL